MEETIRVEAMISRSLWERFHRCFPERGRKTNIIREKILEAIEEEEERMEEERRGYENNM